MRARASKFRVFAVLRCLLSPFGGKALLVHVTDPVGETSSSCLHTFSTRTCMTRYSALPSTIVGLWTVASSFCLLG